MGLAIGIGIGISNAGGGAASTPSAPANLITNGTFDSASAPPTLTTTGTAAFSVSSGALNFVGGSGTAKADWDIPSLIYQQSYYVSFLLTQQNIARPQIVLGGNTSNLAPVGVGSYSDTFTAGSADTHLAVKGAQGQSAVRTFSIDNLVIVPALVTLVMVSTSIGEEAAVGTEVGTLGNVASGSTLQLTNSAGGAFALSGGAIITAAPLDYETASSYSIEVTETLAGAHDSPKVTAFTITVTDYAPTLAFDWIPGSFSHTFPAGHVAGIGSLDGIGSTYSLLDDAGGKFVLSGDVDAVRIYTAVSSIPAGAYPVTVRVTNPDATNSPFDVTHTITLT